ncbi:hypothetical protein BCR34DRAFT_382202 [Clohesyomyces aquaticus]|uniref:Uncharacterized protein n=1 Tax=Clohesyomyces aquaticus TaxID=1231657 RepID=A0A1Y1ZG47_9PLEO|nr:hypothetical protein BCR34DRAFT_382202 [Clohesyomyces aquaticus]
MDRRKIAVVYGLGGIGKTQLALGFAREYKAKFSAIMFLDMKDDSTFLASVSKVFDRVWEAWPSGLEGKPRKKPKEPELVLQTMVRWLSIAQNRYWLVILDNIDAGDENEEKEIVARCVPSVDHGNIIVTTRVQCFTNIGKLVQVERMNDNQAVELLAKRLQTPLPAFTEKPVETDPQILQARQDLITELGGLPLALAQVSAYINDTGIGYREFLDLYNSSRHEILKGLLPPGSAEEDPKSCILTTWKVSLDQLLHCRSRNPNTRSLYSRAAKLLFLFAHLNSRDIWFRLLQAGLLDPDVPHWFRETLNSKANFLNTVRVLIKYSFVIANPLDEAYSVHNLFSLYCAYSAKEQGNSEYLTLALNIVGYSVPTKYHPSVWKVDERLLPHANVILDHVRGGAIVHSQGFDIRKLSCEDLDFARGILHNNSDQGGYVLYYPSSRLSMLFQRHQWDPTVSTLLETELDCLEREQGRDAPVTLLLMVEHVWNCFLDDEYEKGMPLAQESLIGLANQIGTKSREAFRATIAIAALHSLRETFTESIRIGRELLERSESALGKNDLLTLQIMWNLAVDLRDSGAVQESDHFYAEAFRRYEEVLGRTHPYTLKVAGSRHGVLTRSKNFKDAAEFQTRVFRTYWELHGADHSKTLDQAEDLFSDFLNVEDESCRAQILNVFEGFVDHLRDHFHYRRSALVYALILLSSCYREEGSAVMAERCCLEAYNLIQEEDISGQIPCHLLIMESQDLVSLGKYTESERMLELALWKVTEAATDEVDFDISGLPGLVEVYAGLGDSDHLLAIMETMERLSKHMRPSEKHITMLGMRNSAIVLVSLGRDQEALHFFDLIRNFFRESDGTDSIIYLESSFNLGICHKNLQNLERARSIWEILAARRTTLSGPSRLNAVDSFREIGVLEAQEGRFSAAEEIFIECLKLYKMDGGIYVGLPRCRLELAEVYLDMDRFADAESACEAAIEDYLHCTDTGLSPKRRGRFLISVYELLGLVTLLQDRFSSAIKAYTTICEDYSYASDRDIGDSQICLGIASICGGRYEKAETYAAQALRSYTRDSSSQTWRLKCAEAVSEAVWCIKMKKETTADGVLRQNHFLPPGWNLYHSRGFICFECPDGIDLLSSGVMRLCGVAKRPRLISIASSSTDTTDSLESARLKSSIDDTPVYAKPHVLETRVREIDEKNWKALLPELDEALQSVIEFSRPARGPSCWTVRAHPGIDTVKLPLSIAGLPVIVPVRTRYPAMGGVGHLPDPGSMELVDPSQPLTDDFVDGVFKEYREAKGFFLLLNGMLQILVAPDFDRESALSELPTRFHGLHVSYITINMHPASLESPSATLAMSKAAPAATMSSVPKIGFNTGLKPFSAFHLRTGSTIEARAKAHNRTRQNAKVGLKTRLWQEPSKTFLTMPTHVLLHALKRKKFLGLFGPKEEEANPVYSGDWKPKIEVWAYGQQVVSP